MKFITKKGFSKVTDGAKNAEDSNLSELVRAATYHSSEGECVR